jgi:hypothetical protein
VKDAFPQGGWGPFEFGSREHPIDVLSGWAHPVDRELDLIGLVPQEFLPGFSSWGKAPYEELGQQGLRLSFRVNDA